VKKSEQLCVGDVVVIVIIIIVVVIIVVILGTGQEM
jgi:hypothetical protein